MVFWSSFSIRPFTIDESLGLIDVMKEAITVGKFNFKIDGE